MSGTEGVPTTKPATYSGVPYTSVANRCTGVVEPSGAVKLTVCVLKVMRQNIPGLFIAVWS